MTNFEDSEFNCSCCGENKMDWEFLLLLDRAREIALVPFVINSGYRCPNHNNEVGSTSRNHVEGKAADIACTNGWKRLRIIRALMGVGFQRIGIHKEFIHVDSMDSAASMWVY